MNLGNPELCDKMCSTVILSFPFFPNSGQNSATFWSYLMIPLSTNKAKHKAETPWNLTVRFKERTVAYFSGGKQDTHCILLPFPFRFTISISSPDIHDFFALVVYSNGCTFSFPAYLKILPKLSIIRRIKKVVIIQRELHNNK